MSMPHIDMDRDGIKALIEASITDEQRQRGRQACAAARARLVIMPDTWLERLDMEKEASKRKEDGK